MFVNKKYPQCVIRSEAIYIVSMQGLLLIKREIPIRTGQQSITWDINKLPAGTSLLTIQDGEKVVKEKFIKQ